MTKQKLKDQSFMDFLCKVNSFPARKLAFQTFTLVDTVIGFILNHLRFLITFSNIFFRRDFLQKSNGFNY